MAKESKKQLKAQAINEARKQYDHKIERMQSQINHLSDLLQKEQEYRRQLIEKYSDYDELKEENRKMRDWIERLQEYCNMPPEQFQKELQKMKDEQEMTDIMKNVTRYTQYLFGGGGAGLF